MEQRRFVLFVSLSLLIWLGWINFVIPKFFPPQPKKPRPDAAKLEELENWPADALWPLNVGIPEKPVKAEAGLPQHPAETVHLGSADPESGFFLNVQLTSLGGAIEFIELNDPRYPDFNDRQAPLKIVGSDPNSPALTFATEIPALDKQLPDGGNQKLHWEVVRETLTDSVAEFRLVAPDGSLEVVKRYELKKPDAEAAAKPKARDQLDEGYELVLTMRLRNLQAQGQEVSYFVQGPVNLPLEDAENSSKFRDIRMAFLEADGDIHRGQLSATEVVDNALANKLEIWKKPLKYLGVDVKYFAALIVPEGNQLQAPTVVSSEAQLLSTDRDKKFSDISVQLQAQADLQPNAEVEQQFLLFTGPKRQELLRGVAAEAIVDFGWVDPIARGMLWMLNLFHGMGANYGVAIILLTVVVRLAMFPVSRHQAHNMQRMKELQPKIKELQKKYENNKEELGRAQMELFRKHNYNPLSGCLPLFLQLPIFIGLYTALSSSVDLRMAKFLWIDNLASPDALFKLPFVVPWFNWTHFNLLPILSTGLMYFQMKLMTPPPTTEEEAMQQRMMGFMTIFMGVMFYRVPAGLCIYFIASSVWGMVERWILNKLSKNQASQPAAEKKTVTTTSPAEDDAADSSSSSPAARLGELWNRMQQAADKDVSITRTNVPTSTARNGKKKKR